MSVARFKPQAEPATPPPGYIYFFCDIADDLLYLKFDTGTVIPVKPVGGGTGDLLSDGSVALSANWDVGAFNIIALGFESDVATGTAPLVVASTTQVANLNVELHGGKTLATIESEYAAAIAAAIAGLYDHKGAYDASTNTPDLDTAPSGILKGDAYTVSVAGTFFAVAVEAGDVLIADQDNPVDAGDWTIVNRNIDSSAFATAAQGATADSAMQDLVDDTTPQLGGALDVNGQKIVSVSDGDIDIEPHGTGNVLLGNLVIDADATVGAGQDNFVLTYDHATGTWGPEASAGGGGGGGLTPVFIGFADSPYAASAGEIIFCDTAAGPISITYPAGTNLDNIMVCGDATSGTNNITITPNGAETIDDDATFVIDQHWGQVNAGYKAADTNWEVALTGTPDIINVEDYVIGAQTDYYDAASGRLVAWLASGASGPTYQNGGVDSAQPYMFIALPDSGQPNATLNTVLPKRWNIGQVRARFFWKQAAAGAGGIVLGFGTNSANDNESMLGTTGGYGSVVDTAPNDINKIMVTGWTSSAVVTDAPTTGALIQFYFYRQPANASDTLAATVRLLGVELEWTSNAATDA